MEALIDRVAGLDVHQATVVATVRVPSAEGGRQMLTETFGTMTDELLALRECGRRERARHAGGLGGGYDRSRGACRSRARQGAQKVPELRRALVGRFEPHHAFLLNRGSRRSIFWTKPIAVEVELHSSGAIG